MRTNSEPVWAKTVLVTLMRKAVNRRKVFAGVSQL